MKKFSLLVVGFLVLSGMAWADIEGLKSVSSGEGISGGGFGTTDASPGKAADDAITTAPGTTDTLAGKAEDDDLANAPKSSGQCVAVCYDTAQAHSGCGVSKKCQALEDSNGPMKDYFKKVDKMCGLAPGTAIKFGEVESRCTAGIGSNAFGYTGMFQFDTRSCKLGNLNDPSVQAQCLCNYTANSKKVYANNKNGEKPSAGMLYLMHQQGAGCGMPLAFGGNQPAYQVLQQCGKISSALALKRVGCNLPGVRMQGKTCIPPYDPSTITAAQFANLYTSKFNGVDKNNMCSVETLTGSDGSEPLAAIQNGIQQAIASNPQLASIINAAGGSDLFSQLIANSGNLTASGNPLLTSFVMYILGLDPSQFSTTPATNVDDLILGKPGDDDDDDSDGTTEDKTFTTEVTNNSDGSTTVKVQQGGGTTTYEVTAGKQLWECGGTFSLISALEETTAWMKEKGCNLVVEVTRTDNE